MNFHSIPTVLLLSLILVSSIDNSLQQDLSSPPLDGEHFNRARIVILMRAAKKRRSRLSDKKNVLLTFAVLVDAACVDAATVVASKLAGSINDTYKRIRSVTYVSCTIVSAHTHAYYNTISISSLNEIVV
uniref:Uncharacterized protein n=1 Tax=Trichogramma kaykai TaxID=54128 RepID=A0ABD2W6V5_9HYME